MINFLTLVLNGMEYITWHHNVFRRLPFPWHWTIVEGIALANDDCNWLAMRSRGKEPGHFPAEFVCNNLSVDGTTKYLNAIAIHDNRISVIRNGAPWRSKKKMAQAALPAKPCLLMQVDADELWTVEQLTAIHKMFSDKPEMDAAYFRCHFFVGPRLVVTNRETYGNRTGMDWLRAWRYEPGMTWLSHAPPLLGWPADEPRKAQLFFTPEKRFTNDETENARLVFQHFAYASEDSVKFKEAYYGYRDAVAGWQRLQAVKDHPVDLSKYFPWVESGCIVDTCEHAGITPLM